MYNYHNFFFLILIVILSSVLNRINFNEPTAYGQDISGLNTPQCYEGFDPNHTETAHEICIFLVPQEMHLF